MGTNSAYTPKYFGFNWEPIQHDPHKFPFQTGPIRPNGIQFGNSLQHFYFCTELTKVTVKCYGHQNPK